LSNDLEDLPPPARGRWAGKNERARGPGRAPVRRGAGPSAARHLRLLLPRHDLSESTLAPIDCRVRGPCRENRSARDESWSASLELSRPVPARTSSLKRRLSDTCGTVRELAAREDCVAPTRRAGGKPLADPPRDSAWPHRIPTHRVDQRLGRDQHCRARAACRRSSARPRRCRVSGSSQAVMCRLLRIVRILCFYEPVRTNSSLRAPHSLGGGGPGSSESADIVDGVTIPRPSKWYRPVTVRPILAKNRVEWSRSSMSGSASCVGGPGAYEDCGGPWRLGAISFTCAYMLPRIGLQEDLLFLIMRSRITAAGRGAVLEADLG